jgi:hypothetical protein
MAGHGPKRLTLKRKIKPARRGKNRFMAASTLSERDVLKLIFLFVLGSLPRESARTLKLSLPTCYRFHDYMLIRLHSVGWVMEDEGVFKTISEDPEVRARFAAYKDKSMRQHRGFENEFKKQIESMKYNALYIHLHFYERTYAAELASIPNPTREDKRRARFKIAGMMTHDIVRIILQTGPLNRWPSEEQLHKAYRTFTQSMERKVVKFRDKRKKSDS